MAVRLSIRPEQQAALRESAVCPAQYCLGRDTARLLVPAASFGLFRPAFVPHRQVAPDGLDSPDSRNSLQSEQLVFPGRYLCPIARHLADKPVDTFPVSQMSLSSKRDCHSLSYLSGELQVRSYSRYRLEVYRYQALLFAKSLVEAALQQRSLHRTGHQANLRPVGLRPDLLPFLAPRLDQAAVPEKADRMTAGE